MATVWYLDIRDQQPPFDSGVLDGQGRAVRMVLHLDDGRSLPFKRID